MNTKHRYRKIPLKDKKQIFYAGLLLICSVLWCVTAYVNTGLGNLFSNYSIVINNVDIDKVAVIIAPIVEECIKLLGYGIIFLIDFNKLFHLEYKSKKDFIDDNLVYVFLISIGTFGILEGIVHNRDYYIFCVLAFVCMNTLAHLTDSVYPFILGRKHRNRFIVFLPIAIMLHSLHNLVITTVWNHKFVTLFMITVFLLPLLILKRNTFFNLFKINNTGKIKIILTLVFILIYLYIFLCCLLI